MPHPYRLQNADFSNVSKGVGSAGFVFWLRADGFPFGSGTERDAGGADGVTSPQPWKAAANASRGMTLAILMVGSRQFSTRCRRDVLQGPAVVGPLLLNLSRLRRATAGDIIRRGIARLRLVKETEKHKR